MIDTKLLDLYSELSQAVSETGAFERKLAATSNTDYIKLSDLHWMISNSMDRIGRIKGQITELESPDEPEVSHEQQ